jgi:hypothetical protein
VQVGHRVFRPFKRGFRYHAVLKDLVALLRSENALLTGPRFATTVVKMKRISGSII